MTDQQMIKNVYEAVKRIEKILIGDLDKPDQEGLIARVGKNEQFRLGFERTKTRLYMVIIGLIAISLFNIFGEGLKAIMTR